MYIHDHEPESELLGDKKLSENGEKCSIFALMRQGGFRVGSRFDITQPRDTTQVALPLAQSRVLTAESHVRLVEMRWIPQPFQERGHRVLYQE